LSENHKLTHHYENLIIKNERYSFTNVKEEISKNLLFEEVNKTCELKNKTSNQVFNYLNKNYNDQSSELNKIYN